MFERPPLSGIKYESFVDPSGGSNDSMTCAIGHIVGDHLVVVDAVREIPAPFNPDDATDEIVQLLLRYGIRTTHGDRYAAQWVVSAFDKRVAIDYKHCELPRSALYLNLLPHLNAHTIRLLDHPRAVNQICSLERRTHRGGADSIDHPRDQHDDIANAIAGLAYVLAQRPAVPTVYSGNYENPFAGYNRAMRRKRKRFLNLREEAASGTWSAPCTLSAEELARTEPDNFTLRQHNAFARRGRRESNGYR